MSSCWTDQSWKLVHPLLSILILPSICTFGVRSWTFLFPAARQVSMWYLTSGEPSVFRSTIVASFAWLPVTRYPAIPPSSNSSLQWKWITRLYEQLTFCAFITSKMWKSPKFIAKKHKSAIDHYSVDWTTERFRITVSFWKYAPTTFGQKWGGGICLNIQFVSCIRSIPPSVL